eukprot:SAG31_NODE_852_length_11515_cov_6.636125_5_plen_138_part_00
MKFGAFVLACGSRLPTTKLPASSVLSLIGSHLSSLICRHYKSGWAFRPTRKNLSFVGKLVFRTMQEIAFDSSQYGARFSCRSVISVCMCGAPPSRPQRVALEVHLDISRYLKEPFGSRSATKEGLHGYQLDAPRSLS